MTYRIRKDCRLCAADELVPVLLLEPTPPANEFVKPGDPEQERFPLYLVECRQCGHVQLPVVVDPERLFRNYVYVSGTSPSFVDHFRKYAESMISQHGLKPGDLVVEIGSNDGTLLKFFKAAGMRVLGIDPARKIAEQATAEGIETWPEYFNTGIAQTIAREIGHARLVIANNVFAHADDLRAIAHGARILIGDRGSFVFEVQYLVDLIEKSLFDMVYHEHLSYHTVAPLVRFFYELGMSLDDVERVQTHGGSIRCTASLGLRDRSVSVRRIIGGEMDMLGFDPWPSFRARIREAQNATTTFLESNRMSTISGYGAPAKLTTLCHQFGLTAKDIAYVVDDSPWKQGLLTPGTRIPVVPPSRLVEDPPDAVIIFAWNFADQIAAKLRGGGYEGKIVAPLPNFREI